MLGVSWGTSEDCARKVFVANFCTYLGIVGRFMPVALDGAGGKLQGIGADFGLEIYTCMHVQLLA